MMLGMQFLNKEPFKEVYVHALVRDEKGQKMSKSKGNVIDPLVLIDSYSADALRFTLLSMASPGRDVKLSEHRVKGYRNFLTKIWNVNNFLKVNKCNFDGEINPKKLNLNINKWIYVELINTKNLTENLSQETSCFSETNNNVITLESTKEMDCITIALVKSLEEME